MGLVPALEIICFERSSGGYECGPEQEAMSELVAH
jgi:hypothetical protein